MARVAASFELPLELVLQDERLAAQWQASDAALIDHFRLRHAWHTSVAPFYLFWLRGNGEQPPD